jgi:hypothetical protein
MAPEHRRNKEDSTSLAASMPTPKRQLRTRAEKRHQPRWRDSSQFVQQLPRLDAKSPRELQDGGQARLTLAALYTPDRRRMDIGRVGEAVLRDAVLFAEHLQAPAKRPARRLRVLIEMRRVVLVVAIVLHRRILDAWCESVQSGLVVSGLV